MTSSDESGGRGLRVSPRSRRLGDLVGLGPGVIDGPDVRELLGVRDQLPQRMRVDDGGEDLIATRQMHRASQTDPSRVPNTPSEPG